jgi:ferredoxin/flavodoxin---NADP+ reductase
LTELGLGTEDRPLRVAIVGSGPSGFYAAEYLHRQDGLVVQVDMFDRLPTPFGLVRGGVAPDHQNIKAVTRIYDKIAAHPEFRFYGNIELGRDLTHEDLKAYYHAVIYAVGARADRRMGISREYLPGSHSAREFVGWYNADPDFRSLAFDFSGTSAVIVGNGNVAMDLARILLAPVEELHSTDIAEHALQALGRSHIREVIILGRRGPAQAAFTTKELRELGDLPDCDVIVAAGDLQYEPTPNEELSKASRANLEVLRGFADRPRTGASRRVVLRFLRSPVEIVGTDRVRGVVLARNELYEDDSGSIRARMTDQTEVIPADLVFRSIGYQGVPLMGIPFDADRGVIPNVHGRVIDPLSGVPVRGEYVVGWIKRGPRGIIGTNKPDSQETVELLLEDLRAGTFDDLDVPGRAVLECLLGERRGDFVSYDDWQIIDMLERERGREAGARPRLKFSRIEEMLSALAERKQQDRRAAAAASDDEVE